MSEKLELHQPEIIQDLNDLETRDEGVFRREEQRKDNELKREKERQEIQAKQFRESKEHRFGLVRDGVLTIFGLIVLASALYYTGKIILDPNASAEAKQFATGFWGTVIGGSIVTYLFPNKQKKGD